MKKKRAKRAAETSTVRTGGGSRRDRGRPMTVEEIPAQVAELRQIADRLEAVHEDAKKLKIKELKADGVRSSWEDARENAWLYIRRLASAWANHPEVPAEML